MLCICFLGNDAIWIFHQMQRTMSWLFLWKIMLCDMEVLPASMQHVASIIFTHHTMPLNDANPPQNARHSSRHIA